MDLYQQFIAKSRYARYLPEINRREHWEETVERYLGFMSKQLRDKHQYEIPSDLKKEIKEAIINLEVMPSMRSLMTAGEALSRDNVAGYNCSYLPIDDPKSFDEAMYILLCGTGVGFSVEQKYINKLPEVPELLFDSSTTIVVSDSKEGWAKALRQVLALLWSGEIPKWDFSKVRPAGARLKVFGGRASGAAPLEELFKFSVAKFKDAKGRRLTSLECHDILCKIGEVVVVGGVRRSAMISLSDLSDPKMATAKSGAWWEANAQRALANNSVAYEAKPDVGQFLQEWNSLYESKSGERGIFSRAASKAVVAKNGRRDPNYEFGTNPCSEIILRPYQFCNLTECVVRESDTAGSLDRKVRLASILGTWQSTLTHFPYLRKVWAKNTEEERLLGVSLTGIYDNKLMAGLESQERLEHTLENLREAAVEANREMAEILGIPQSTAITAVKPSGTVSQLVDAASGIHTRHAPYYIRRVRGDVKDPLTQFLIKEGVPAEPCVMKPDTTVVFSFPKKAPEGAVTRDDVTALEHLKLWLTYQRHWCEHKPSVTISVKEEEWPSVGAWVWEHFDEMSGVSFLPHDGGSYRQAPYEEFSEEQYVVMKAAAIESLDWSTMIEETDETKGSQELACTGGSCEIM